MKWTAQTTELLVTMWQKGKSTREIMETICATGYQLTRNAVIGKAHRLGLSMHIKESAWSASTTRDPVRVVRRSRFQRKPAIPVPPPEPPSVGGIHIMELEDIRVDHKCRFVLGEPRDLMFCGVKTVDNKSWCADHMKIFTHTATIRPSNLGFRGWTR